jgi:hypothetical protein
MNGQSRDTGNIEHTRHRQGQSRETGNIEHIRNKMKTNKKTPHRKLKRWATEVLILWTVLSNKYFDSILFKLQFILSDLFYPTGM